MNNKNQRKIVPFQPHPRFLALAVALALSPAVPAHGALVFWNGAVDNDWNNTGNWTGGVLPGATDTAYVNDLSTHATVIGTGVNGLVSAAIVGNSGPGDLTISGGGTLSGSFGSIGLSGGDGTAAVTGTGSSWTTTTSMTVGQSASGSLSIFSGGLVNSGSGSLGSLSGFTGSVSVDGTGSLWAITNSLGVGQMGQGILTVSNSGAVTADGVTIGANTGGDGTATVTGAGSSLSLVHALNVGDLGAGVLDVLAGGNVNSSSGVIGRVAGAVGTVTVDGAGSQWSNIGTVELGRDGQGTLNIINGATASAQDASLGGNASAVGTVLVDGAGSQWNLTGSIDVGLDGQGGLTLSNGGVVTGNLGYIGRNGGTGTVLVTGAGSVWNLTNDLLVADVGHGDMTIAAGASVVNGGNASVGNGATGIGSVAVTGAGSTWQLTGALTVGNHGSGTVTVANGGAITTSGILIALSPGTGGALSIGALAGLPAAAPGDISAANITFGLGAGVLNFNHTATAYTFATPILSLNNTALINQVAGTTILTADNSGFLGTTTISGGKLVVNNALGGTVAMVGGTLGGVGTLGGLAVHAGATLAPGNSIGTLNVAGNTAINAGATYAVEVDDLGNADLLHATGTVTIDPAATVHVTPANGTDDGSTYAANTLYTIVTGDAGVTGTFGSVTDAFAFLDPSLSYDATHAYLTLTKVASFTSIAQTPNQLATAGAAQALGSGNAIFDAVLVLGTPQALAAFDGLSGEIHATARGLLLDDSRFVRDAALRRMGTDGTGTRYWLEGVGSWADGDGDGNAADYDRDLGGVLLGGDTNLQGDARLGFILGFGRSNFQVDDRRSSGSADTWQVGGYGGKRLGNWRLGLGAAYARHDLDTSRQVAFTGFTDSLSASYKASTAQAFGELAYRLERGNASLEPFAGLAYVSVRGDDFNETGGTAALSTSSSTTTRVTYSTLGLRAAKEVMLGATSAHLHGALEWQHAFGDTTPDVLFNFAGGGAFSIAGAPIARNSAVFQAGAVFDLGRNAALDLAYMGRLGSGVADHGATAELRLAF